MTENTPKKTNHKKKNVNLCSPSFARTLVIKQLVELSVYCKKKYPSLGRPSS